MNRVFLYVVALAAIFLSPSLGNAQSIYMDASNSGPRGFGLGIGGAFQFASLGIADLDAYAGVRNYFID